MGVTRECISFIFPKILSVCCPACFFRIAIFRDFTHLSKKSKWVVISLFFFPCLRLWCKTYVFFWSISVTVGAAHNEGHLFGFELAHAYLLQTTSPVNSQDLSFPIDNDDHNNDKRQLCWCIGRKNLFLWYYTSVLYTQLCLLVIFIFN